MGYGGSATEGQYAGTAVVAATDAILGAKSEGVPAGKATTEGDGGPGNLGVIDITEGDGGINRCGTAVFTVGEGGSCGGDRGIVGCGNRGANSDPCRCHFAGGIVSSGVEGLTGGSTGEGGGTGVINCKDGQ